MGYKLKLDIYQFSLYRILERRHVRNGAVTQFRTEENAVRFEEYARQIMPGVNEDNYMNTILQDFMNDFNNTFALNDTETQGVTIASSDFNSFNSHNNTFWGQFKGGTTGIRREIYDRGNAQDPTGEIRIDDISSVPYFFEIWMPLDSDDGYLFVQSYTSLSCATAFRNQLGKYFISKNFKPVWNKRIPKHYIDNYLRNSVIKGIRINYGKSEVPQDAEEGITTPIRYARKYTMLDQFAIPFESIADVLGFKRDIKEMLENIDIDVPEDENDIKIFYTDDKGASASASMNDIETILPNIILDDELLDGDTQLPRWAELHTFIDELLEEIKTEIGYTPQEND